MVIDQTAELPIDAARAMLNHLRQFPADTSRGAGELAAQFNLPVTFVQNVLTNAVRPASIEAPVLTRQLKIEWPGNAYRAAKVGIGKFALKPIWFILTTNLILVLFWIYLAHFVPDKSKIGLVPASLVGILGSGFLALVAQSVCFYRNRRILLPIQAAFINWATATSMMAVPFLQSDKLKPETVFTVIISGGVGILMLCVALASLGVVIALLGNWAFERNLDRRETRLTRQEQLERYFELQSRLERGTRGQRATHWLEQSWFARSFRKFPIPTVIGFWGSIALATMVASSVTKVVRAGSMGGSPLNEMQAAGLILIVGLFVLSLVGMGLIGFLTRSISKAMFYGFLGSVTTNALGLLPIGEYGLQHTLKISNIIASMMTAAVVVILSGFAGLAGELNQRAAIRGNVDRNDPAAIMAEMLRIQWRLSEGKQNVCVLVVDAAKSSRMKAEADALDAEYAFRLYQEWIAEICTMFGGKVHSTAGDGAVVSFHFCKNAFDAARKLQTDIERFNRDDNVLAMPFRIRIGLHHGSVSAEIDEVEFTEVIDIAAHVEGRATVGGIAVTDDVVANLNAADFIPLAEEVDGKQLFLARNPTEE